MSAIQIALVDDDHLVVQLLHDFFRTQPTVEVVMTAQNGTTFLQQLAERDSLPKIVMMDLKMENGSGIEAIEQLNQHYPTIHTIVLSSYYKPHFTGRLLQLGASAFLSKETDKAELLNVIQGVHENGHYLTAEQLKTIRKEIKPSAPAPFGKDLSERELDVLRLIAQQLTAKEIGERLFISTKTVETHKSNLLLKTGTKNTAGLIIYAAQRGLIDPNDFIILE